MAGFEPGSSESDHSTSLATTAPQYLMFLIEKLDQALL